MAKELPTISTSNYSGSATGDSGTWTIGDSGTWTSGGNFEELNSKFKQTKWEESKMVVAIKRIVQVFIVDPNEDVPLVDSLLYSGDQLLTDSTNEELFYGVNIAGILAKHNEKRVTFLDKEVSKKSGRDVFLDPVKIRELKMTVVEIARF